MFTATFTADLARQHQHTIRTEQSWRRVAARIRRQATETRPAPRRLHGVTAVPATIVQVPQPRTSEQERMPAAS